MRALSLVVIFGILHGPAHGLVGGTEALLPSREFLKANDGHPNVGKGWFPSTVLLNMKGEMCTGTILSPYLILTAAHCAVNDAGDRSFTKKLGRGNKLQIFAGVKFDEVNYTHERAIRYLYVHPSYFYSKVEKDIAQIAADIAIISLVEPIDVPPTKLDFEPFGPTDYPVKTGFGCESLKEEEFFLSSNWQLKFDVDAKGVPSQPDALLKAQRDPFIAQIRDLIDEFYTATRGWFYDEDETLAKPATLCSGDSGGPLFKFNEKTGVASVVGVNSRSRLAAPSGNGKQKIDKVVVDLHTRIDRESALRIDQWIERAMKLTPEGKGTWFEGISFAQVYARLPEFQKDHVLVTDVRKGFRIPAKRWVVEVSGGDDKCPYEISELRMTARKSSGGAVEISLKPVRAEESGHLDRLTFEQKGDEKYAPSKLTFQFSPRRLGKAPLCYVTTHVVWE